MKRFLLLLIIVPLFGSIVVANQTLPYRVDAKANQMGTLSPSTVAYNYYDAQNRLSQTVSFRASDLENLSQVYVYTYNDFGIESEAVYNADKKYSMSIYVYDEEGQRIRVDKYAYDQQNGDKFANGKVEFTYEGGKLILEKVYEYNYQSGELFWSYDLEYKTFNELNLPLTVDKISIPYGETESIITEKREYTYDATGKILSYLEKWKSETEFLNKKKKVYTYNAAGNISNMDEYLMGNMEKVYAKYEYSYDANNILIKYDHKEESWDEPGTYATKNLEEYINVANYSVDNAPRNFNVEFMGEGKAKLSWEAPVNTASLQGYAIFVDGVKQPDLVSATQFEVSNLVLGEHYFMVQAKYDEIGANASPVKMIEVVDANCMPPTDLQMDGELVFDEEAQYTPVTIKWTAPASPYDVLGYNLYINNKPVDKVITETKYTNKVYQSGTYNYTISAIYAEGTSPRSIPLSIDVLTKYKVSLASNIPMGTLTGAGWHYDGSEVEIIATPKDKFVFESWTEKLDGDGGYKIVSNDSIYKFNIKRSTSFTATFKPFVGVENLDNSDIKIYQSNNKINVESVKAISKIEVIDMSGRTVATTFEAGTIDVAIGGVYVVRVVCGESVISKKILINK